MKLIIKIESMIEGYLVHLLIIIAIYIILATSLNLTIGYGGLLNLGHVAFFGIGAYASTLLNMRGWPYLLGLLAAGCVAAVFGAILMLVSNRLKGDYLALATLGFNFVVYSVFLNWTGLTRGPLGIPGIPKPNIFGWMVNTNVEYLIFSGIVAVLVVLFLWVLTCSGFGRLIQAVRDNEVMAKVLGKNTFKIKTQSMATAAFFAGIAGSLYAHYITFIDPSSFALAEIILVITIVLVGGLATLKGSIWAVFLIILIPEALRFFSLPSSILGPMRQIIYALLLVLILVFRPRGLAGKVDLE